MNTISQTKRYLPHDLNTKLYAVLTYRNGNDINYVCRKYHISRSSLWRWNKKYDGSTSSLANKSHKPISPHPNSHTSVELDYIKLYISNNPTHSLLEIWYKLKHIYSYSRHPLSLYRILKKLGF